jgi:YebC/PmpR family DNA-binding regulatory protein
MIQVTSDNLNRTVADFRHLFTRFGGNLGSHNSVAWMFEKKGQIYLDASRYPEDAALEAALDAGADDLTRDGDQFTISTEPTALHAVRDALKAKGLEPSEAEIALTPKSSVTVRGGDAEKLLKLMEALEEHDDVAKVYSNFDIDAETMAAVSG